MTLIELTFMQQSEGRVERPFSLSEEEQLAIHSKDFNVFMATGRMQKLSYDAERENSPEENAMHGRNSPSHYFDWVLFGHDVIQP